MENIYLDLDLSLYAMKKGTYCMYALRKLINVFTSLC